MRAIRWSLLMGLLLSAGAAAQNGDYDRSRADKRIPAELPDEFYPTKSMVSWVVEQSTNQFSESLGLDPQQKEILVAKFMAEIPRYLAENRDTLQPTINNFINMMASQEAPTPEKVAEWAQKALPAVEGFTGHLRELTDSMREHLTDEQNVSLDGMQAAFDVGTKHMLGRLSDWGDGGFDATRDWHRSPGHREREREREQKIGSEAEYFKAVAEGRTDVAPPPHLVEEGIVPANAAVVGGPGAANGAAVAGGANPGAPQAAARGPAAAAAAKDEWTLYVEQFCDRYQLNAEQRAKASQFLARAQAQRADWMGKKGALIERLEQMLKSAKTEDGKKQAEQQLSKLKEPFSRHFNQLKEKLDKLPTAKQRSEAALRAEPAAAAAPQTPKTP